MGATIVILTAFSLYTSTGCFIYNCLSYFPVFQYCSTYPLSKNTFVISDLSSEIMKSAALISFAVSGLLVRAVSIRRDYDRDEHLVFSDCGITPDGASKSRQMMYYAGNPWNEKNNFVSPQMMVDVPWDGSYPWRTTGVSSKMPNGDVFTVIIDPAIPDYDANNTRLAGKASHTYDEHNLDCYAYHKRDVYTDNDGTKCSSAYICNHYMTEEPPKVDPPKSIRYTNVSFSSMTVDVEQELESDILANDKFTLVDPYDAFHKIFDDIHGSQCNSKPYPIGDSCSIIFNDCNFVDISGHPADETAKTLGTVLTESAGREISKNVTNWKTYRDTNWYSRVYNHRKFTYPQNGRITMYTELEGDPESVAPQSWIKYEIQCGGGKSSFCGKACQGLASVAFALGTQPEFAWLNIVAITTAGVCTQCA